MSKKISTITTFRIRPVIFIDYEFRCLVVKCKDLSSKGELGYVLEINSP